MAADQSILQPGTRIKPFVSMIQAAGLINTWYGLEATDLRELPSYDDRNFFFKLDCNSAHLSPDSISDQGYVLKVTNWLDSQERDLFDAQSAMMLRLRASGVPVPVPIKNIHGQYMALQQLPSEADQRHMYMVRVLTFIPGKTLFDMSPWTSQHFVQCGRFVAKVGLALAGFHHPAYQTRKSIWFLSSVPKLRNFTHVLEDPEQRQLVLQIIDKFESDVLPAQPQLEAAVIHGDMNEQNLLVRPSSTNPDSYEIFSVIDFGDSQFNPVIYELAIAIMYMMTKSNEIPPHLVGGHVLAGYLPVRQLTTLEKDILRTCIAARYAQSLTLGAYSFQQDPTNAYVLTTAKTGWLTLRDFWTLPKDRLHADWASVLGSYNLDF